MNHHIRREIAIHGVVLCLLVAVALLAACVVTNPCAFVDTYQTAIRQGFFSGFLSLGGFLLALKTFILVKMKEGVYDSPLYQKRVVDRREIDSTLTFYGPLRDLSFLLYGTILLSFCAALLQVTLGLWGHVGAAVACLSAAGLAFFSLVRCLFAVRRNLNAWFDDLEQAAKERNRRKQ